MIFLDEMSGRRKDRPQFQKLIHLIENREVEIVVVRQDRLSRDSDMFQTLSKLFERTGVQLYETIRGRFINFKNPDEWAEFQRSGINAEHEARVVSLRAKERKEFMRFEGKVQGGRMPFGYRRSAEGFYEPVPEEWDKARRMIEIFLECESTVVAARQIGAELGIQYAYNGLHKWLQNYVLRGHTPYFDKTRDEGGCRKPSDVRWNTHSALITPEMAERIDRVLAQNKRFRGRTKNFKPKPLSGLLYCDRCGSIAHINGKMIYCNSYRRGYGCLGTERPGRGGNQIAIGTRYADAEKAVIEALMQRSEEVAIAGTTVYEQPETESAEVLTLRQQIQQYEALNDPDLMPVLEKKRSALQQLLSTNEKSSNTLQHSREKLAGYAQIPDFWQMLTSVEREVVYREFVDKVCCAGLSVKVLLKI